MATAKDPNLRNGAEAVRLAKQAVSIRSDGAFVDTLAAAYAEAGQFDDAVREQQRAIKMFKQEGLLEMVQEMEDRLSLYRRGQPYRE